MECFTPSMITSNSSLLQPKIEMNLFSEVDPNLGSFQKLETQLLDDMEISEQQLSYSHKTEVFGDDYMHEPGTSISMPSLGSKNSTCLDDTPSIGGGSSAAKNVPDALPEKHLDKRPKHDDTLCKCSKVNDKIPVLFPKKDGHPVGEYASQFMTELGKAVKEFAPLQVSSWKRVTDEQKQPIFDRLESLFSVDFSGGPNSVKKETDNLMSKRYRDNRQTMHRHYKTLTHLPWEERLKHVPTEYCRSEADWEFLCKLFESDAFKKISAVNSQNAKSPYTHHRASKPLTQSKYYAVTVASSNETDTNPEKGRPGETATIANIGSDNHDDGSQSLERLVAAKRARDQVQDNRARYVSGLRNGVENAKATSSDDTSRKVTKAELRNALSSTQNELNRTKLSLQSTQDKVRFLEANQKHLEERIEANERMMKHVFERIASDITQSLTRLPSSAPRL